METETEEFEMIKKQTPAQQATDFQLMQDMGTEAPPAEVPDSDIFKIELITPRSSPAYAKINGMSMLNKDITTSILTESDMEYVEELHDTARHYMANPCLALVAKEYAHKSMLRENIAVSRNGAGRIMLNTEIREKKFDIRNEEAKKKGWLR